VRLFVLGAPCAGKSTVAARLRRLGIDVVDADEEILLLNSGVWPDTETKNERFLPRVLDVAGSKPEVVVFNSYLPLDQTRHLRDRGFVVVLLDVSEEELLRRDRVRLAEEGWTNIEWFEWHQSVIREHHDAGLIDDVIDGERSPDDIAAQLLARIRTSP
jgi:broad-specificity NMP kinase